MGKENDSLQSAIAKREARRGLVLGAAWALLVLGPPLVVWLLLEQYSLVVRLVRVGVGAP